MASWALEDQGNAFDVGDILAGLPALPLDGDDSAKDHVKPSAIDQGVHDIGLPRLEALKKHPLDDLAPFSDDKSGLLPRLAPIGPLDHFSRLAEQDEEHDIWQSDLSLKESTSEGPGFYTWEAFSKQSPGFKSRPGPFFLSEAGPTAFDAALEHYANSDAEKPAAGRVVQSEPLLRSLWQASLGQSSLLFPLGDDGMLVSALADARISGCSLASSSSAVQKLLDMGNVSLRLRRHVGKTYQSSTACATEVALARSIEALLDAVEEYVVDQRNGFVSLTQLVQFLDKPNRIVNTMNELHSATARSLNKSSRHRHRTRDLRLFEAIFGFVTNTASLGSFTDDILQEVLSIAARPWLQTVSEDIGLQADALGVGSARDMEYESVAHSMPQRPEFLSEANFDSYVAASMSMNYIAQSMPDHPMVMLQSHAVQPPRLDWCRTWADVQRVELRAKEYEQSLATAIQQYSARDGAAHPSGQNSVQASKLNPLVQDFTGFDETSLEQQIDLLNAMPNEDSTSPGKDAIRELFRSFVASTDIMKNNREAGIDRLPLPLMPNLSLQSLLDVQIRLLSHVTLHSIFHTHRLRDYVRAHCSYSLFASGIFSTRLGDALFSTAVETTERQKGKLRTGRKMGLNLGSDKRKNWPPASSELRLALMGILNDCWQAERRSDTDNILDKSNKTTLHSSLAGLPGDLSFSIRTLSSDQIEQVLNPDSLHALDFLRLSETLPASVRPVLTEASQNFYDSAFGSLLRLLRVRFTVLDQIPRDLRLLEISRLKTYDRRTEVLVNAIDDADLATLRRTQHIARHVVSALSMHFALSTSEGPMSHFCRYLDNVAESVDCPVPNIGSPHSEALPTLASLAARHERVTGTIAASLFAQRHDEQQQRVAAALDRCLGHMLLFGRCVRDSLAVTLSRRQEADMSMVSVADSSSASLARGTPVSASLYADLVAHVADLAAQCTLLAASAGADESSAGNSDRVLLGTDDRPDASATAAAARSASGLLQRLRGDGSQSWLPQPRP